MGIQLLQHPLLNMMHQLEVHSNPQKIPEEFTLWSEEFGLHPSSIQWQATTKMMIRNIPARCTEPEFRQYLNTLAQREYVLEMPKTSASKCKGYAFVQMRDPEDLVALAREMWQTCVPSRMSPRPLKIHPAEPQGPAC
ncbi:MRD1 [Symbiodinium microadriaticum]|nr:MRD1 [Symbiodinium microadriaticum]